MVQLRKVLWTRCAIQQSTVNEMVQFSKVLWTRWCNSAKYCEWAGATQKSTVDEMCNSAKHCERDVATQQSINHANNPQFFAEANCSNRSNDIMWAYMRYGATKLSKELCATRSDSAKSCGCNDATQRSNMDANVPEDSARLLWKRWYKRMKQGIVNVMMHVQVHI